MEMSKIDKVKLEAQQQDTELRIREAQWLENLRVNGRSPEDVEDRARQILGIDENGSVIQKANEVLPKFNIAKKALIEINALTEKLQDGNLISQEEGILLKSIERRLAEKIANFYGLESVYKETQEEKVQ
jgi:hydroxymethylpyrimidine pyrophosphatase-like HAD family hydrolase